jgi:hypothetical protein
MAMMRTALIALGGFLLVIAPGGLVAFIGLRLWQAYRANKAPKVPVNTSFDSHDVFCAPEGGMFYRDAQGCWVPFSDKEAA